MTLEFTQAALSDLRAIRDYTLARWGEDQEQAYLGELWTKFEQILSDPGRWRFRPDLFPECQIAAHKKHVVLFRIRGTTLQVVRILHGAMDLPRHVPDDLD